MWCVKDMEDAEGQVVAELEERNDHYLGEFVHANPNTEEGMPSIGVCTVRMSTVMNS